MPTYVPFAGPAPDLPSTRRRVDAALTFTYPKSLVKSVLDVPGKGEEVSAIVSSVLAAPVAMEQNAAWQAVNKQLGATFKIILTPTADYVPKLNTVIAGGDLPDLLSNIHTGVANAPDLMRTQCADLTPYLSGDAVKDYPNLANIPPACWKQTVFNGGIYAIPVPRAPFGNTWKVRQDLVDQAGLAPPKNATELKQYLVALTKPQSNQWAVASTSDKSYRTALSWPEPGHGACHRSSAYRTTGERTPTASWSKTTRRRSTEPRSALRATCMPQGCFTRTPPPTTPPPWRTTGRRARWCPATSCVGHGTPSSGGGLAASILTRVCNINRLPLMVASRSTTTARATSG